jgi:hypothetical protein
LQERSINIDIPNDSKTSEINLSNPSKDKIKSWDEIVDEYKKIYEELIGCKR